MYRAQLGLCKEKVGLVKNTGRLVVLIAKDTIDEAYYWIGKRKIKSADNMADKLIKHLEKTEHVMDDFF